MILIAAAFIGIAAFVGLAIDLGILIVSQAHLRRAVDAAALAAATQVREGTSTTKIKEFATQMVEMNGLQRTTVTVETCDDDPDICQGRPRKLIRVSASMEVGFTFLSLVGLRQTTLVANSVAEAASVDMVIVIGTNETMGRDTPGYNSNFNPGSLASGTGCNGQAGPEVAKNPNSSANKCRPLWDAKQAAKVLVSRLFPGADRVAIVTYDFGARVNQSLTLLSEASDQNATASTPSTGVYAAIDNLQLFNAANAADLTYSFGQYSPINRFCIPGAPLAECSGLNGRDPYDASAPVPNSLCMGCGIRRAAELLKQSGRSEALWIVVFLSDGFANISDLPTTYVGDSALPNSRANGFCDGGLTGGGPNSAWGLWNAPTCRNGGYDDGFGTVTYSRALPGGGSINITSSKVTVPAPFFRMCGPYHPSGAACPPGSSYVGPTGVTTTVPSVRNLLRDGLQVSVTVATTITVNSTGSPAIFYSAEDYARDMIDIAALQVRCSDSSCLPHPLYNPAEAHNTVSGNRLAGANMVVFTVGLGSSVTTAPDYSGARLLRYMAAVGDDGDRATDPCVATPGNPVPFDARNCGNYYYAQSPSDLIPVFEAIAERIFTRLTR